MTCRPWWAVAFAPYVDDSPRIRVAGCQTDTNPESDDFGWNLCPPEHLRAAAEVKLQQLGDWAGPLSLDVYSLARNIASEAGSGTIEMKVALALSTMGRAKLRGRTVTQVILANRLCPGGASGPRCLYGRIHGQTGVDSAPFGRWTASSQDPTLEDVLAARFALEGRAGQAGDVANAARGADDQWSPLAAAGGDRAAALEKAQGWCRRHALQIPVAEWVGPIPGVHPLALMLTRTRKDLKPGSQAAKDNAEAQATAIAADVAEKDPLIVKQDDRWKSLSECVDAPPSEAGKPRGAGWVPGALIVAGAVVISGGAAAILVQTAKEARLRSYIDRYLPWRRKAGA